ncbi:shikimate kinase 3, chloroplastic-like isoform X1 [Actinidia eriantha]|uniref:shikimate kinase 3, chloroplastic-like isoform X1 n=1 Tax=Actinidia eriantha TaxID=165200 RepID=UPI00258610E9|nr:shikimate kinase 3, chloroplastic-like isoform X1 [Actinidia eriantha]
MEAVSGTNLQLSLPSIKSQKIEGKIRRWNGLLRLSPRHRNDLGLKVTQLNELQWRRGRVSVPVLHACKDPHAPALQSGNLHSSFDENWLLKNKGEEVLPYLNERCIFLVGMMGSGKTTVGKILSEALGYSFVDSDKYVEDALGGSPVAQIFKQFGESFFRDNESEVLRKLSSITRQVVSTGGGAVICPINWKYMREGVTVYLDIPLDVLARRIAAEGTDSRPILDSESGDAYTKAFTGLLSLSKKRAQAYAKADAKASLQHIATKLDLEDLSDITPTDIALEVLVQIEDFLQCKNGISDP